MYLLFKDGACTVKLLNTNQRKSVYVITKNGTIRVAFDADVIGGVYYRIFKSPNGKYIARDEMDKSAPWKFICSVKLPKDISKLDWQ